MLIFILVQRKVDYIDDILDGKNMYWTPQNITTTITNFFLWVLHLHSFCFVTSQIIDFFQKKKLPNLYNLHIYIKTIFFCLHIKMRILLTNTGY